jgi:raffinose/stachyose/melibiose transport system substrate-binding protein
MEPFDAAVTSHTPLDILLANGQNIRLMVQEHLLSPLNGVVPAGRFVTVAPFTFGSQYYGAPVGGYYTGGVLYNKAIFARYKLPVPRTFAAMKQDATQLNSHGIALLAFGGASVYNWPPFLMETIQQASGDRPDQITLQTLDTGKPPFTAPIYVKAMTALADLGKWGVFEPGWNGVDQNAGEALFTQGRAAMFYGGTWLLGPLSAEVHFPLGVERFPTYMTGVQSEPPGGPAFVAAIYHGTPKPLMGVARKWVKYITSKTVDAELLRDEHLVNAADVGVTGPGANAVERMLSSYLPHTFTFLDWYWPPAVTTAMQHDIQAVTGGAMSPVAALKQVQHIFVNVEKSG